MAAKKRAQLPGSTRQPVAGFRSTGAVDSSQRIEITVTLKPRAGIPAEYKASYAVSPLTRPRRNREEVQRQCAASEQSIARVQEFARDHNLQVLSADARKRTIILSGTVGDFDSAFGVALERFEDGKNWYRGRVGAVQIPEDLKDDIESVLGLDNRPQAKPHFRRQPVTRKIRQSHAASAYSPTQVAALYHFPAAQDGAGQCIALVELGGGYRETDLQTYFQNLKIPLPAVKAVGVDGASNSPTGTADGPDGEVALDIEIAGAVAPKAQIVVYFAPNTDRGFVDAVNAAVHDEENKPSIVSISWGGPESTWTGQAIQALDSAFQTAAAMDITICVASGDDGSTDGVSDGKNHVDFPASSPHVLACGGTRLQGTGSQIASETAWNDGPGQGATGGGFSATFPVPDWQAAANRQKFRGVPDVSGDADPETGYQVLIDGSSEVFGGTSAVAPLWAGLIARLNQALGRPVGYLNPIAYAQLPAALNDITTGNNGAWSAGPGWDPCTGLGSPDGTRMLSSLTSASR
jgi:kumamolisin